MNFDTTIEMYQEDTINFFLQLKESIKRQTTYINEIMNEQNNFNKISCYYTDIKNDKIYTDLVFNNDMVDYNLSCKLKFNDNMIKKINYRLCKECNHEIVEDYIEGGVENEMIKIKYCKKCELNLDEINFHSSSYNDSNSSYNDSNSSNILQDN